MKKIIFLLLLGSFYLAVAQPTTVSNKVATIDSILASYCNANEPGMAIGIVQNGKVIYKNAIGKADLSNSISITDSTVFNIASVSKHFTALVALMAEEEGKISLEDDITTYLPELENLPYRITLKQLANHTHGLPNYSDLIEMMGFSLATPLINYVAVQMLLSIKEVNFKPGTKFQYGNTGYILLAEILSRVYKKSFPNLIKEKVFDPLHMTQTRVISNPDAIVPNKALAYKKSGSYYTEYPNRQMECGSSNIHTSINDLLKWAVNFQNPTIGSQKQINRLKQKTKALSKNSDLAYGLGLYTETYKGLKTVFHGGGTAGYRAYILHVPDHNFSIITLGNQSDFGGLLIVQDLIELFFKDKLKASVPVKTAYTAKELKAFEGWYRFQPGQYWRFRADDKNLYFGGNVKPLPLIGDNTFKFSIPTSRLTFYDNKMEVRIADFVYHSEKMTFDPPVLTKKDLEKFMREMPWKAFPAFFFVQIF